MDFITEPEKKIPVIYDVDVAVAGGGIAGTMAALAAARQNARTVVIDRFGYLGGNMGPGLWMEEVMNVELEYATHGLSHLVPYISPSVILIDMARIVPMSSSEK